MNYQIKEIPAEIPPRFDFGEEMDSFEKEEEDSDEVNEFDEKYHRAKNLKKTEKKTKEREILPMESFDCAYCGNLKKEEVSPSRYLILDR